MLASSASLKLPPPFWVRALALSIRDIRKLMKLISAKQTSKSALGTASRAASYPRSRPQTWRNGRPRCRTANRKTWQRTTDI